MISNFFKHSDTEVFCSICKTKLESNSKRIYCDKCFENELEEKKTDSDSEDSENPFNSCKNDGESTNQNEGFISSKKKFKKKKK